MSRMNMWSSKQFMWIARRAAALAVAAGCQGDPGGAVGEQADGIVDSVAEPAVVDPGVIVLAKGSDAPRPLSAEPVPQPSGGHIVDRASAIRLGKALFWDIQVGSDGQTACASCHFIGGADNRRVNTLNPGPDTLFASGNVTGPGQPFTPVDLVTDDRVGSQGVAAAVFQGVDPDPSHPADLCVATPDPVFGSERQVTGRNAPTVIGAVFYRDVFWDGRANHVFNGVDPFGTTGNAGAPLAQVGNAALASQATGPALSSVEMSCAFRGFNDDNGFSLIWGEAVAAYESTLIPDQTPLDRYLAGTTSALTAAQQRGLNTFQGKGSCTKCHAGPAMSDATVSFYKDNGGTNRDGGDQGFHNLGVRPTVEDLGRAGIGPNQVSFSVSGKPADRGAFKTPGLRNVKLTSPYFHNGGKATLADVVAFYSRGGDFANPERAGDLKPISLSADDQAQLVDFLTNGLTDCRVEMQRPPFDHPALPLPNGKAVIATGAAGTGTCP
jgi:cytochrome c peroxidase